MARKPRNGYIRNRLERVRVHSNADGSFGIEAVWRPPYGTKISDGFPGAGEWLPPGLFTRMHAAQELERHLNYILGAPDSASEDSK